MQHIDDELLPREEAVCHELPCSDCHCLVRHCPAKYYRKFSNKSHNKSRGSANRGREMERSKRITVSFKQNHERRASPLRRKCLSDGVFLGRGEALTLELGFSN